LNGSDSPRRLEFVIATVNPSYQVTNVDGLSFWIFANVQGIYKIDHGYITIFDAPSFGLSPVGRLRQGRRHAPGAPRKLAKVAGFFLWIDT
jgi:hypothetical protein